MSISLSSITVYHHHRQQHHHHHESSSSSPPSSSRIIIIIIILIITNHHNQSTSQSVIIIIMNHHHHHNHHHRHHWSPSIIIIIIIMNHQWIKFSTVKLIAKFHVCVNFSVDGLHVLEQRPQRLALSEDVHATLKGRDALYLNGALNQTRNTHNCTLYF
jgi:hypothetical protein